MAVDPCSRKIYCGIWCMITKKKFENTGDAEGGWNKNFSLIIGYLSSAMNKQQRAALSFSHNIPLFRYHRSDAGISGQPFFCYCQFHLKTHTEPFIIRTANYRGR